MYISKIKIGSTIYDIKAAAGGTDTTYSLSLNGSTNGDSTNGTSLGTVYAPTTAGTSGQILTSSGSGAPTWANAPAAGVSSSDVLAAIYTELYGQTTKPSGATTVTNQNLQTTLSGYLQSSDISAWAKASTKPSYAYSEIGYAVNATSSAGGTLSLAGTTPLHVVTLTGNVSALTLSVNPADGHSCHVILTAASEQTVAIAHDATNRVCPEAEDISLTVAAGGYVEIDFLSANNKVYVRGI